MTPFPLPQVDPGKLRRNQAQAGIRTLLVGVLCLFLEALRQMKESAR